ncbi:peptide-methionine (S)-S-oxide reductase MsrA [Metamycoplasma hyosynoviae]|uniref:peptide-methionine (S)-S-oxide reductase MsrA n=1 Tax=Metamycoplasma hyosynoviae TaxID=29559 RepID=UPI00236511E4|nr:peptide-methionine (S)-S-oxide reductase MsrA [Metamycoplasma hyosynoviae]MDD7896341.1 peptide-methionine (S)-S-oxide reductase MsrA [Metamycoplasma hyosynoviae]
MKKIYIAGGCFWGVQAYFKKIAGVIKTTVGYANSDIKNPFYELVKSHSTTAAETVEIEYDPTKVSLQTLVEKLFSAIDPTALNYQGPDYGKQYRNGIYFVDDSDEKIIKSKIQELAKSIKGKVVTEVLKLQNYYLAEDYHQDYVDKHPETICHIKL